MATVGLLFGSDHIETATVAEEQVRYGLAVRLPFRLRVKGLVQIPTPDDESDVWILNRLAIPDNEAARALTLNETGAGVFGPYDKLWSNAIVILRRPVLRNDDLSEVRAGNASCLSSAENQLRILRLLNEVIFGYARAAGSLWGGQPLRLLDLSTLLMSSSFEFGMLRDVNHDMTKHDIESILRGLPKEELRQLPQLTDSLVDLDDSVMDQVPGFIAVLRQHAYHEIAYKAQMASVQGDPIVALLLACAALEGAHAHFVRSSLSPHLIGQKNYERLIEDLFREQGFYSLLQLSAALIPEALRPTDDELAQCLSAITKRNSIMHAKQKKGRYTLRTYSDDELYQGVSALLKLFKVFVDAVDRSPAT